MGADLIMALCSISLVVGVLLTLHFIGKRPINVNIDARAEAHGGTAYTSSDTGSGGGGAVGGFFAGIAKIFKLAIVGACVLLGAALLLQKNEPAQVTVNVPEQKPAPVVVNVPQQPAPKINIPAQPAPIVNAPVSTSAVDIIGLLLGGIASLATLVVSFKIIRSLSARDRTAVSDYKQPISYERTPYGWHPIYEPQQHDAGIDANDVAPGLFRQNQNVK